MKKNDANRRNFNIYIYKIKKKNKKNTYSKYLIYNIINLQYVIEN